MESVRLWLAFSHELSVLIAFFMLLVKDDCPREVTDQGYRSKGMQDPCVLVNLAPPHFMSSSCQNDPEKQAAWLGLTQTSQAMAITAKAHQPRVYGVKYNLLASSVLYRIYPARGKQWKSHW